MKTINDIDSIMQQTPYLSLNFYTFGMTIRKDDGNCITEYPVDPGQVGITLSENIGFGTGLLSPNTLYVGQSGINKIVVEYRSPRMTGLYLEDSDVPIRIPMPPLIMMRKTTQGQQTAIYKVYAVKTNKRPETLNIELYNAPLPNIGGGGICWGSVVDVDMEQLQSNDLSSGWDRLLGSPFGSHLVMRKSKRYSSDIRKLWSELETNSIRRYPIGDLVSSDLELSKVLGAKNEPI